MDKDDAGRGSEHEDGLQDLGSHNARLRLKQVEMSLAQRSSEDLDEQSGDDQGEEVQRQEIRRTEHCRTTSHVSYRETEAVTEIHNPRPQLAPEHVCAWRTRYMDLSTEVDQLKSEAGSRGVVVVTEDEGQIQGQDQQHHCPEIGIEGLTIVMHMRGKDDLVINTNLKQDGGGGVRSEHRRR